MKDLSFSGALVLGEVLMKNIFRALSTLSLDDFVSSLLMLFFSKI